MADYLCVILCYFIYVTHALEISGSSKRSVVGESFTITCSGDSNNVLIQLRNNLSIVDVFNFVGANPDGTCKPSGSFNIAYMYRCENDSSILSYNTTVPGQFMLEELHYSQWTCRNPFSKYAASLLLLVDVPVTSATMTTTDTNEVVNIILEETHTFTCTTGPSRPVAKIEWYIGKMNITHLGTTIVSADGTKFIASSTLVYTGKKADHNNMIYCEAMNIEGIQKITSDKRTVYIQVPVTELVVTPAGVNNIVSVGSGESLEFTCTTDYVRPIAWIHWYIGTSNVTTTASTQQPQPNGTMFISSSKLQYVGNGVDHNKTVRCDAGNIERRQNINSEIKTLYIGYRPDVVVDLKVVCFATNAVVMWRSESNKGSEQFFRVLWQNLQSDIVKRSHNMSDPGVNSILYYTTEILTPKSLYSVTIESTNNFGTVRSTGQVYCNTSGYPIAVSAVMESTPSFSAEFGSGAALIVAINIIVIIAVVILKKRRQASTGIQKRGNVYEQTKHNAGVASMYNELNELSIDKRNPADNSDRTYEDIGSDENKTSNTDRTITKKGKSKRQT